MLSADHREVLLTLHAKAGRWFQLGGHCEPGDRTLADAALREATEESGVAGLVLDPVPVHLDEHEVSFCGAPRTGPPPRRPLRGGRARGADRRSATSPDVRWWPVDALPEPDDGLVARALERLTGSQSTSDSGPAAARPWAAADQPSR